MLNQRVSKCLAWVEIAITFPKVVKQISTPTNNVYKFQKKSFSCPTFSPTVGNVNLFNFSHCAKITLWVEVSRMALICISLIKNGIEQIFLYFLSIWISSLVKCLFEAFVHFLIGYQWETTTLTWMFKDTQHWYFFLLLYRSSLLYNIQIFYQVYVLPFLYLNGAIDIQMSMLIKSNLSLFSFTVIVFVSCLRNLSLCQDNEIFSYVFS